jgi:hypothetical protein
MWAIFAAVTCSVPYSESEAKYFVDFSGAAYCGGTLGKGVASWSCAACQKHPNVTATVISEHTLLFAFNGFVAYDADTNRVILSVAGTDPLKVQDWIDDLSFAHTDYYMCSKFGDESCQVHEGFLKTYQLAILDVRTTVEAYLKKHPSASFHVTGHSLGAIVALYAALDLKLERNVTVTSLTTVGQPRGGDAAFARFAAKHFGNVENTTVPYYRLVHFTDPVPDLPPSALGFTQPPQEIYYGQLNSLGPHVECNLTDGEDPSCSDRHLVRVNLLMHLNYVGFDFISNYIGCKL